VPISWFDGSMEGIVEIHAHIICTSSDADGWYCNYVYLDGHQCQTKWGAAYPVAPGTESRVFTRDAVREWVKAGGQI